MDVCDKGRGRESTRDYQRRLLELGTLLSDGGVARLVLFLQSGGGVTSVLPCCGKAAAACMLAANHGSNPKCCSAAWWMHHGRSVCDSIKIGRTRQEIARRAGYISSTCHALFPDTALARGTSALATVFSTPFLITSAAPPWSASTRSASTRPQQRSLQSASSSTLEARSRTESGVACERNCRPLFCLICFAQNFVGIG
jgi:hypothetical protein